MSQSSLTQKLVPLLSKIRTRVSSISSWKQLIIDTSLYFLQGCVPFAMYHGDVMLSDGSNRTSRHGPFFFFKFNGSTNTDRLPQLGTLAVQEAMGMKVDREAVATLVLPQLWAMSMGPRTQCF